MLGAKTLTKIRNRSSYTPLLRQYKHCNPFDHSQQRSLHSVLQNTATRRIFNCPRLLFPLDQTKFPCKLIVIVKLISMVDRRGSLMVLLLSEDADVRASPTWIG